MSYLAKSYLISLSVMFGGIIIGFPLRSIFFKFGYAKLADSCLALPAILLGIHILFGKYVCIMGKCPGVFERILIGLGLLVLLPIFLILSNKYWPEMAITD